MKPDEWKRSGYLLFNFSSYSFYSGKGCGGSSGEGREGCVCLRDLEEEEFVQNTLQFVLYCASPFKRF